MNESPVDFSDLVAEEAATIEKTEDAPVDPEVDEVFGPTDAAWQQDNLISRREMNRRQGLDWALKMMEANKIQQTAPRAGDARTAGHEQAVSTAERLAAVAAVYARFVETGE